MEEDVKTREILIKLICIGDKIPVVLNNNDELNIITNLDVVDIQDDIIIFDILDPMSVSNIKYDNKIGLYVVSNLFIETYTKYLGHGIQVFNPRKTTIIQNI